MKKEFSKKWNSSIQPRKQRKYLHNAPIHVRRSIMKCNLTKDLRKKFGVRNMTVRKGDTVKILRGDFKGRTEKVEKVNRKDYKLYLSNVFNEKKDGTKVKYPVYYSNVRITELELSDKKRIPAKKEKVTK
ncbi:50S ribosomal protein L24 [Candidatus Tiddalikarchaeum anstoanum]|nr:50S ribosomal protein L24 [Candidatus Tiddalikarchaeum anstoanum]